MYRSYTMNDVQKKIKTRFIIDSTTNDTIIKYGEDYVEIHLPKLNMIYQISDLPKHILRMGECEVISENDRERVQFVHLIAFLRAFFASRKRLSDKMDQENHSYLADVEPHIRENVAEFTRMNSGGKFFRGALVNIGFSLFSSEDIAYSDQLALAYELFQTAILIHDDIIDHATVRRNRITIPESYIHRWENNGYVRTNEMTDTANSMALCAGDTGLFLSIQKIVSTYADSPELAKILQYYIDVVIKTIKGEVIDVILPYKEKQKISLSHDVYNSVLEIYKLKTAWYTVIGPLCSGAILGGCSVEHLRLLEEFAEYLGIAFQIQDDILGVFRDTEAIGKDSGSDIAEFKTTILYSYVKNREEYSSELLKYYGKPVSPESIIAVRDIFVSSGALSFAKEKMDDYLNKSLLMLNKMDFLSEENKELLYGMILYLKTREK